MVKKMDSLGRDFLCCGTYVECITTSGLAKYITRCKAYRNTCEELMFNKRKSFEELDRVEDRLYVCLYYIICIFYFISGASVHAIKPYVYGKIMEHSS